MSSYHEQNPSVSIIIPIFNEELSIPALSDSLNQLAPRLGSLRTETIFVDDHSTDRSSELLRELCLQNPTFHYLRLSRNSGSHVAILAGLEHSRGSCAVFLAADLQDPPEIIPDMLDLWRKGYQVVWAVREQRKKIGWTDRVLSSLFYRLLNRFGQVQVPPQGSDFALVDKKVIGALLKSVGANPSIGGEIARLGFRQIQIPYTKSERRFGRSNWSLERKLIAFADAFVSFSYMPLRAMSYLGLICSILGAMYALFIIVLRVMSSHPIEGWASLMVVVLVLGGIQMTMLGVIGEYLWRTLEEARRRPRYFIEEEYSEESPVNLDVTGR